MRNSCFYFFFVFLLFYWLFQISTALRRCYIYKLYLEMGRWKYYSVRPGYQIPESLCGGGLVIGNIFQVGTLTSILHFAKSKTFTIIRTFAFYTFIKIFPTMTHSSSSLSFSGILCHFHQSWIHRAAFSHFSVCGPVPTQPNIRKDSKPEQLSFLISKQSSQ